MVNKWNQTLLKMMETLPGPCYREDYTPWVYVGLCYSRGTAAQKSSWKPSMASCKSVLILLTHKGRCTVEKSETSNEFSYLQEWKSKVVSAEQKSTDSGQIFYLRNK